MARVVVERITDGSSDSSAKPDKLKAPSVTAIRVMFGVGKAPSVAPDAASFKPVYTLQIPVFALGALDSDGVHEMDAAAYLERLQTKATMRRWAARLEIEIQQPADAVAHADIWVDTEDPDDAPRFHVADRDPRGTTIVGGARSVTLRTSLASSPDALIKLGGKLSVTAKGDEAESAARPIEVQLGRFEFQPG